MERLSSRSLLTCPYTPTNCKSALTGGSAENKRGYRYSHCVADPQFRHKQYYRSTDTLPYGPRMSFEDTDKWIHYDTSGRYITNEKGWRMARANVCAREGTLYYEVRIVRGVPSSGPPVVPGVATPQPHVRMGWARREAPLDAPVGFDGYSYGVTDIRFETMHRSRSGKFFQPKPKRGKGAFKGAANSKQEATIIQTDDHIREGDVVGLEISLPSLSLHRKVVSGVYNPAVDLGDGFEEPFFSNPGNRANDAADAYDVIRDRIPVPYKGNVYFEIMDYVVGKAMEAYSDRTLSLSALSSSTPTGPASSSNPASVVKTPPNPNHVEAALRTLPHSAIRVYKNGDLVGTAFENLLSFLPPASAPSKAAGAREGFDDGLVGYFPAVACFSGGIAEVNFGEDGFWCPPSHLSPTSASDPSNNPDVHMSGTDESGLRDGLSKPLWFPGNKLRPIAERYKEQIAEDVVWDIIDEVDFFLQDGGFEGRVGAGTGVDGMRKGGASLKEEVD